MTEKKQDEVQHRRDLQALGQRAVDYYVDTGLCVFCEADDCTGEPHDPGCDVGRVSGVELTPQRIADKSQQRTIVEMMVRAGGVVED